MTVLSETEIQYDGRVWQAGQGKLLGQFTLRPGWLRQGGIVETEPEGELWTSGSETLEPNVGPAWAGCPYIPTPSYVREQIIRRRAGLPLRERRWLDIRANPRRPQTGPSHGFHQCGIKLTGSDTVSPYISTHDLYMLEAAFCLYMALLLVELMLTTASRLHSAPVERMLWPCLTLHCPRSPYLHL